MLKHLQFPLGEEAVGVHVNITGGLLAGRRGQIDALPTDPQSRLVLVELDRDGGNVWIEVEHLEETSNVELYHDRPEIMQTLRRAAETVMRRARKAADGEHLIGKTTRGLVALRYSPAKRDYTLTTQDGGSWTASGPRSIILTYLMNLFPVGEEAEAG